MFCDIHNHVLFGVDDGSQSLEESLQMLDQAVDAGIDTICATPHVHAAISERSRLDELRRVYATLGCEIKNRGLDIQLHLGCEIYYTADFSLVAGLEIFRYRQNTPYVLVELPPTEAPPWFADLCFSLRLNNINVLLAHPERNAALMRQPQLLHAFIRSGVYTQVTAGSLIGRYGSDIQKFSEKIIRSGACTIVATDAHNTTRRPFSDAEPAFCAVEKMVGTGIANQLFDTNPRTILGGGILASPELNSEGEEILLRTKRKKVFFLF